MPKKVAIMGMGAAGSFAAAAAMDQGCEVTIYQYGKVKTSLGMVWFPWIPETLAKTFSAEKISILSLGTAENYSDHQWGRSDVESSFPKKNKSAVIGYNPSAVLESLVPVGCDIHFIPHPLSDTDIADIARWCDVVFQTFPTKVNIQAQFNIVPFVVASWPDIHPNAQNFMLYNGTQKHLMVREASLFGTHFLEFSKNYSETKIRGAIALTENTNLVTYHDLDYRTLPIDQDPHAKIQLVGRWAEWNTQRLSHEVYDIVKNYLKEMK